ncbi:MAG: LysM domain-containing protein [Bacillota bacterium]|jgi:hypothetical protein
MANMNLIEYTIQPGDTLWELAYEYETTVEAIMAVNPGIDPDNLLVGQTIALPEPEANPAGEEQWVTPGWGWRRPWWGWGPRPWYGPWRFPRPWRRPWGR